jgi:hypothetical protein
MSRRPTRGAAGRGRLAGGGWPGCHRVCLSLNVRVMPTRIGRHDADSCNASRLWRRPATTLGLCDRRRRFLAEANRRLVRDRVRRHVSLGERVGLRHDLEPFRAAVYVGPSVQHFMVTAVPFGIGHSPRVLPPGLCSGVRRVPCGRTGDICLVGGQFTPTPGQVSMIMGQLGCYHPPFDP